MSHPLVVCGFPGVGKSFLCKTNGWHDSDSSKFSWSSPGVRHADFPSNYISHIQSLSGVVLASSHKVVRDALAAAGIPFWLCYPSRECCDEYVHRYVTRGSPQSFVDLLKSQWGAWTLEMSLEHRCVSRYVLGPGQYAADVLKLPFKTEDVIDMNAGTERRREGNQ